jgi:OHCU decarboxylase
LTLEELNALPEDLAAENFRACCGSSRWVDAMVASRPFESRDDLFEFSDAVWRRTDPSDWHEAFSHHPRIGERSSGWSAGEQSSLGVTDDSVRDELARANRAYEDKFGQIYIVCATGKSAGEMLALANERMANDAATELKVAAEEQRKITQLRLRKLLGDST